MATDTRVDSSLLRSLTRRLRPRERFHAWRRNDYLRKRAVAAHAPFPPRIHEALLAQLHERTVEVPPFVSDRRGGRLPRVYVRYDIDTEACVAQAKSLLEIQSASGLPCGIYLRADEEDYPIASARGLSDWARGEGFEVGLHSSCYVEDDFEARFVEETERFADALGFRPSSFTVHGLGSYRSDVRQAFTESAGRDPGRFGYAFSDCDPCQRQYDYVIQDCHLDAEGRRFIYGDAIAVPPFFSGNRDYLILVHPCYWR